MRYYLATTGISEIWDLDREPLLLGPWCLINKHNKILIRTKGHTFVPSPWKPASKIKEAADYCHSIYKELLPQLCEGLNFLHKIEYPDRYWQLLIGPWLSCFIQVLYDRYKRIEKAFELFPDSYTHVLPDEQCKPISSDTYDFYNNLLDDFYNLQLFSILARELYPKKTIEKHYRKDAIVHIAKTKNSLKHKLFNVIKKVLESSFGGSIILADMYHLSLRDRLFIRLKTGFNTISFLYLGEIKNKSLNQKYSPELRKNISLKKPPCLFASLLYKIIPAAIPTCYVENYVTYKASLGGFEKRTLPRVVGSTVGWATNEKFKFFAGQAVAKGAAIIEFQHGGVYGTSLSIPSEDISLEKDVYYTWGWRSKKANNSKPLPSPYLSNIKDTHKPTLDNILFVGKDTGKYHYRFTTVHLPEDMPKYFEDEKVFFKTLPEQHRNKVLYRPALYDYGWGKFDIIREACPNIKLLSKGKLVSWLQKVRLAVVDQPATALIEALTINVPSVFYWDHEIYLMRPDAERYFRLLQEAGILFTDPASAANKVKEIFDNPAGWWFRDDVQKARLEFCKQFCYARKDWANIWAKELRGLIDISGKTEKERQTWIA